MRLVIGDALHSLTDLGTGGLRLDANGFLGAEKSTSEDSTAWSEGHPLSEAANHLIASMVRKLGGFTFQELNLTIDDIREIGEAGADLSYDFINRPAYQHALATADTEFLRLTLRKTLELGVDPASLVHALQNHDELTYELVHWSTGHRDDVFTYKGEEFTGEALGETVRPDLLERAHRRKRVRTTWFSRPTASRAPLPRLSRPPSASSDLDTIEDVDRIRRAHLLLAMFNALQPGVFALSGWDLCGMLTLPTGRDRPNCCVAVTRVGYTGPPTTSWASTRRLPHRAPGCPGAEVCTAPSPINWPTIRASYASCRPSSRALPLRNRHQSPDRHPRGVPARDARACSQAGRRGALPTHRAELRERGRSGHGAIGGAAPRGSVSDMFTGEPFATVDDLHSFAVEMPAHHGLALLVELEPDPGEDA